MWADMHYENEKPIVCHFCRPADTKEDNMVEIHAAIIGRQADTLDFCDEDIQVMFKDLDGSVVTYFTFEPLMAQLIKELRLLRESLRRKENYGKDSYVSRHREGGV